RAFLVSLTGGETVPPEVDFLLRLPARMDEHEVIVVAVIALVLAVIAAIYPSWRASRPDPGGALPDRLHARGPAARRGAALCERGRRARGAARRVALARGRRVRGADRALGQRQVDPAPHRRPARPPRRRRGADWGRILRRAERRAAHRDAAQGAR